MTEKRYMIEEIGNMFRVLKDNEPLTTKFENCDKQDVNNLIAELNELHEENEQSKMMIATLRNIVLENEDLEKENNKLKKETNELKQQFILLLKKLGKKNVQCSFCEHGEHYSELVDGYYEPRFICHKKGQEYTQRSFCEDWKIKVKE